MRIQYFPTVTGNDYQRLYAQALAKHGIYLEPGKQIDDNVLAGDRSRIAAVHFHWLEGLISADSTRQRLRRIAGLYNYCRHASRLGIRVIWTVHNHRQHQDNSMLDPLGHLAVARRADLIITHSRWSQSWVRRWYRPRRRVVVMPHGDYPDCFVSNQSVGETRREYRLAPDRPVVGMVGSIRPYRGVHHALAAIKHLAGQVQLLIAGWTTDEAYQARLADLGQGLDYVSLRFEGLSTTNYANAIEACDVILLPYERVTTSGAMMSAWTLGRPVIASDQPYFLEFITGHDDSGRVVKTGHAGALADAIRSLLAIPTGRRYAAARQQADRYSWDRVTKPVVEAIQQWQTDPSPGSSGRL